ncbi:hypothetical protein ACIPMZ_01090 [Scandinavium goeteborgense]|jgi:hypothetical protein|uniref:hypothetical protein n=1 Tax=Scandinavium goeteborgense TaxID=1851514 RepID=UPI001061BDA1|nr:hypothetical protein [Scandinavium goeteborgense]MCS2155151.1 hypothetical protein [Scandinavium goeteborgense]
MMTLTFMINIMLDTFSRHDERYSGDSSISFAQFSTDGRMCNNLTNRESGSTPISGRTGYLNAAFIAKMF